MTNLFPLRYVILAFIFPCLLLFSGFVDSGNQSSSSSSESLSTINIDIDGNGKLDALTDGLLILRSMFGLTESALVTGAVADDAIYSDAKDIESRIGYLGNHLDIDKNGTVDALTDGLIILRYLSGYTGYSLVEAAVASNASRVSAADIELYMAALSTLDLTPPTFTSSHIYNTQENKIVIGTVTAIDGDTDEELIVYSVSGSELLITSDGVLSFASAPDFETKSSYSATITATDGMNSSIQEIIVNVTDIDDEAPMFTSNQDFSSEENRKRIGWVTATDIDSDDESIRFRVSGSELKISPAGLLRFAFAPDYEAKSRYTATVTATDGKNSSTQIVIVTVTDIDDTAPIFTSDANFNIAENQTAIGTVTATDIDTDDGLITYSVSGSELLITSDGVLSFSSAPDYETKSSFSATVTATDGINSTTQDVTVTVTDVDDVSPVFTSDVSFSAAENQTAIGTVTATDIDTDDGLITYSVSGSELLITSDGVLSFASAPDYEAKSSYSATITANDGINSTTQSIFVSVTNVNERPAITSEPVYRVNENQTAIGFISAADDSESLIYELAGTDAASLAINNATGELEFISAPDYEVKSTYSAIARVYDDEYFTQKAFQIFILNLDDTAPVLTSASTFLAAENQTAVGVVTATDIDTDDGLITYSISGSDLLITSGGELSFASAPDYEAKSSYSATVTATDGANSASQDITVIVTDVNDLPPVLTSDASYSAAENQTAIGTVTATDIDTDDGLITFTVSGSELLITADGLLSFASAPDYEAKSSYSATVTATDGINSTAQLITVTVTDVDDVAPVFTLDASYSAVENQTTIGAVTATDIDTDDGLITYSVSGTELLITSDGVLSFASAPDYEAKSTYSATVTATDGINSATLIVAVAVTDIDDTAPVFSSDASFSAAENQTAVGAVTATDIDTDDGLITYSISGSDLLITSGGELSFASAPDYETKSSYSATVTATDGTYSATQDVTVTVTDIDDTEPVFSSDANFSAAENQTAIGTVTATDIDTDDGLITYSVSGTELLITSDGVLSFASAPDYEAKSSYSATVTATDGINLATQIITVTVDDVDDVAPVFTSDVSFSAAENQTTIGQVTSTDIDTDDRLITYSVSGSELLITSDGVLSFASAPDYETESTFSATVTATDGVNSMTLDITVTVINLNDNFPEFTSNASFDAAENQLLIGTVSATDADNDQVTFGLSGADASLININTSTGELEFNAAPDYETKSSYSITITASDGMNSTDQNLVINIADIPNDEFPIFTTSTAIWSDENQISIGTIAATDADSDLITFSLSGADASSMSLNSSTGELVFNSAPDYEAKSSYFATVTASDGTNVTSQDIIVYIVNLNDNAPVFISSPNFSAMENQSEIGMVIATDADYPSQSLYAVSYSISGKDSSVMWIDQYRGRLGIYGFPDYETKSTYEITVTANDGVNSTTQDITITILDVNEAPILAGFDSSFNGYSNSEIVYIDENTTLVAEGFEATDIEGDSLTYSISNHWSDEIAVDNMVINPATGELRFIIPPDYESGFTYKRIRVSVSDGEKVDKGWLHINVVNINDNPPVLSDNYTPDDFVYSIDENATSSHFRISISDDDGDSEFTWSITGTDIIVDSNKYVSLASPKDYEADPRTYTETLTVSDGVHTVTQDITIMITPVDEYDPVITGISGVSPTAVYVHPNTNKIYTAFSPENQLNLGQVTATDLDEGEDIQFRICRADGRTSRYFNISDTGVITWKEAPDYESPPTNQFINGGGSYGYTVIVIAGDPSVTSCSMGHPSFDDWFVSLAVYILDVED